MLENFIPQIWQELDACELELARKLSLKYILIFIICLKGFCGFETNFNPAKKYGTKTYSLTFRQFQPLWEL